MAGSTRVYLEVGSKRTFAMALDWPGWGRSGRDAEEALVRLADYGSRYALVTDQAKVRFPAAAADQLEVVESVSGSTTTDFGAPEAIAAEDGKPLDAREAGRIAALVAACWVILDGVAARSPQELRKGPRGGGRDRDKMIGHVIEAEVMYARKIGVRHRQPAFGDQTALGLLRTEIIEVISAGGTPQEPRAWPIRYAARRTAWHVLDHAWEMEDRGQ